jgi:hypothetical protein
MQVIASVLKETQAIRALHSEDRRLGSALWSGECVPVKIIERAQEYLILAIVALCEPERVFAQLEPALGPLASLCLVLDVSTMYRRAGRNCLIPRKAYE